MYRDTTSRLLFVLLLLAVAWFAGQVIAPFIAGLTWAAVLVVTFRPFHRRLQRACGGRQWVAPRLLTLLVAAFVIVPVTLVAVQAVQGRDRRLPVGAGILPRARPRVRRWPSAGPGSRISSSTVKRSSASPT